MNFCLMCNRKFASQKALKSHFNRQTECYNHFLKHQLQVHSMESPEKQSLQTSANFTDTNSEINRLIQ